MKKELANRFPKTCLDTESISLFEDLPREPVELARVAVGTLTCPIAELSKANRFKGQYQSEKLSKKGKKRPLLNG